MRIALVLDVFDPRRGGAEQWTGQFANWLVAAGHDVHVVARQFASPAAIKAVAEHAIVAGRRRTDFAAQAEAVLRRLGADVTHDMGSGWHCDVFQPHGGSRIAAMEQNLWLSPAWRRPFKRNLAPWLPRYRDFAQLTRRQYSSRQRVYVALSRMVAEHFIRLQGVPENLVRLIYNGVDVERFHPRHANLHRAAQRSALGIADDDLVLLLVAHNLALKGAATLLRAARRLKDRGSPAHVIIVGGKQCSPYQRLARQLGCERSTHFLGAVCDPVPWYAACDLYVQPTWYDPCSLVVLEALASGVPVITTRHNGAGELITPGVEGHVLADPNDDGALAARIEDLACPVRRRLAAGAARQLALKHTFDRNCRELTAVYDERLSWRSAA